MPAIKYVIFDMDGLLIDTESVYTKVTNTILAPYGVEMSWDIKAGLMGMPERAASEHLLSHFPGIPLSVDSYITQRRALQDTFWPSTLPLPGASALLSHLHSHGVPIAVATGSQRRNYELKTSHLSGLFDLFDGHVVCGDDERLRPGRGKPAPDVFLIAARELGFDVGEEEEASGEQRETRAKGLVFEDAKAGVLAGKRAGMHVIWIPDDRLRALDPENTYGADEILPSLTAFNPEEWGLPALPA
ncbi:HAD-like protein [Calocera viscosa TUFC12733]|uniref:HAD-like protein n=1 Tax=Calocera viscosa (strain TUFC12733) TaxID=1330018 RepID=A0A167PH41_CALVF|nr:HAD-like protein [Calocera viscosa TUFC12733]